MLIRTIMNTGLHVLYGKFWNTLSIDISSQSLIKLNLPAKIAVNA